MQIRETSWLIFMISVRLKVCGVTSYDAAVAAIDCGAEYLGFNFYRPSPRYIAPTAARAIIERLPPEIVSVGVFVNEPQPEAVIGLLRASGAQLAQLHGDETAQYCAQVGAERVIRALRVGDDFDPASVTGFPAAAVLLDAFDKNLYGGTGRTANWNVAARVAQIKKTFLAGGLTPDNIVAAIQAVRPFAVDVNSGVESAPGRKDPEKLRALGRALDSFKIHD